MKKFKIYIIINILLFLTILNCEIFTITTTQKSGRTYVSNNWEIVEHNGWLQTEKLKVEGGWIYRSTRPNYSNSGIGMCFVPSTNRGK